MALPPAPLPEVEYHEIYGRVPRLTVEVVLVSPEGVLLTRRQVEPCRGMWHLPGSTVRYGEPLTEAVHRTARDELGVDVTIDRFLGYIEYPSHAERGLDWPVGLAFVVHVDRPPAAQVHLEPERVAWFAHLPAEMHDEQKRFLAAHELAR